MAKFAVVVILFANFLCAGQTQGPDPAIYSSAPIANEPSHADDESAQLPTFYSHARQVLVTVSVWKHAPRSADWVPKEILKRYPVVAGIVAIPPLAQGLSQGDFHVFDNGVEQRVDYLEELDISWRDTNRQWYFYPRIRGTWGDFINSDLALDPPAAIYVIGYAPPQLQSGTCHTLRVVAGDNDIVLNRTRYCDGDEDEGDTATAQRTKIALRMQDVAKSQANGSIKVSIKPFAFWSSRVLSLMRGGPETHTSSASTNEGYRYVVVVHDSKAPATVQVATEYELEAKQWDYSCPKGDPAIYVLGVAYAANGDVVSRFSDRYSCRSAADRSSLMAFGIAKVYQPGIPTRFNTQLDLRPGDYDLHVVVSDGHKFGQARMPLHVESIDSQKLAISDLAVNGTLRDASLLIQDAALVSPAPLMPSPLVSKHVQFIPEANARIAKNTSLPIYFEVYEPLLADRAVEVSFRMKITDLKDGKVVLDAGPTSAAQCITAGNVVVPIALNIDTSKLKSAKYTLEIQALDSAGRTTEWRRGAFEIQ